jgi:hypothetical protein
LATSNKDFKIKNGLIVEGATATVDGSDILTTAASVGDLADVSISSPENSQVLSYEASTDLWKNITISGSSGIIVSPTPPTEPTPTEGTQWFNSSNGTTYIYYDSFWIPTSPPKTGPQGPAGDDGATGPEGPQGPAGADGADALWNFTGAWANGVDYDPGDVVEFNGSSYYAPTGIFSSYSPPNNGWLLVASKGDTGEAGEDGATGPAGADGEDGATGDTGPAGPGVPTGGTDGQILTKTSSTDYETAWEDIPESAAVISSATPPENTSAIWFNTETGNTYIYYDNFWTSISGASGSPIISDTAPSSPVLGMQWFNSTNGKTYLYYSGSWIEVDSNGTAAQPSGNAIINGAFDIWQRGTSFSNPTNTTSFTADRFFHYRGSLVTGITTSRQDAGLAGFRYCARVQRASGNTGVQELNLIYNTTETFQAVALAGKAVTFSFYARAGANYSGTFSANLVSGTGIDQNPFSFTGSSTVASGAQSLSSSWQRFSLTGTMPSNSTEFYSIFTYTPTGTAGDNDFFEITGVQLEEGAVATPFKRNAPSIQAELAACQRYFWRANLANGVGFTGFSDSTTSFIAFAQLPVPMRTQPVFSSNGALEVRRPGVTSSLVTVNPSGTAAQVDLARLVATTAATQVQGQPGALTWSSGTPSIDFSAEL